MSKLTYALAVLGAMLFVAGCGSSSSGTTSTATTASTPATTPTTSTPAMAAAVTLKSSQYGSVLYGPTHEALYLFEADQGTKSTCYSACAQVWPPLTTTGAPSVGAGLKSSLLGTTKRTDGTTQVTYGGHPLYYYAGDTSGTIEGQGLDSEGGYWYVVTAAGQQAG